MSKAQVFIFFIFTILYAQVLSAQGKTVLEYQDAHIKVENKEKSFKLQIKSNYYLDAGGFLPVGDFGKLRQDDNHLQMGGDVNFHSLQTAFQGKFDDHWGFMFQFDYAKRQIKYLNMELRYFFDRHNSIKVGNMKVPGSMSINHSTSALKQLARPLGLSLGSGRRMGMAYFHTTPRLFYALGLYTYNINDLFQIRLHGEPELAVATRLGYNIICKEDEKLFGALSGYFYRPQDGLRPLDLKGGIESNLSGYRFVRAIVPESKHLFNIGAELVYQSGRFLAYAELLGTSVNTSGSGHNPFFFGWSTTATYVLLGQPRAYSASMGEFSGKPYTADTRGLELGVRVSGLSLNSGEFVGGAGVSYSAFVTYWLNSHLSLLAQVSYLDHSADALGAKAYTPIETPFNGADFMLFQLRVAMAF